MLQRAVVEVDGEGQARIHVGEPRCRRNEEYCNSCVIA